MDYNAFLTEIIEKLIVAIPQLVAILYMVSSSLSKVKKKTAEFPDQLKKTKDEMTDAFNESKTIIKTALAESKEELSKMLQGATKELREGVTEVMTGMQSELKTYREQLQAVKSQANLLVLGNRAMFDVIISLVAKNPELVKQGLSVTITNALEMTQEQLKDYSIQMIDSLPLLETVLKEAFAKYSPEELDAILESVGYERKE